MLIVGIIGCEGKLSAANLIHSILTSTGKKISVVDSKNLLELDTKRIKGYLRELGNNSTDILILKLNISDIEKLVFDDIHFDVMIYTDKVEDIPESDRNEHSARMDRISSLMADKGVAIVNVDDGELIRLLQGMKQHIVTYGFNSKASITTSSIGDAVFKDGFICCLQRTISARNGDVIEPQEYKLNLESSGFDTHTVLAAASFAIVNGIDLNRFS